MPLTGTGDGSRASRMRHLWECARPTREVALEVWIGKNDHLAAGIFANEARPYLVAMVVSETSETTIADLCPVGPPMKRLPRQSLYSHRNNKFDDRRRHHSLTTAVQKRQFVPLDHAAPFKIKV